LLTANLGPIRSVILSTLSIELGHASRR
jgi:hypothetical protein